MATVPNSRHSPTKWNTSAMGQPQVVVISPVMPDSLTGPPAHSYVFTTTIAGSTPSRRNSAATARLADGRRASTPTSHAAPRGGDLDGELWIRERLGRIGAQQQDAGGNGEARTEPHHGEEAAEPLQDRIAADTQCAQAEGDAPADQQRHADGMEDQCDEIRVGVFTHPDGDWRLLDGDEERVHAGTIIRQHRRCGGGGQGLIVISTRRLR